MTERLVIVPATVFHDRIQRRLPSKLSTCQFLRGNVWVIFISVVLSRVSKISLVGLFRAARVADASTAGWCDKVSCRQMHLPHATFSHAQLCVQTSRTRVAQVIKACASQYIHTSSLRAMSHALTHSTPSTCTPSSPVLVPRSLVHCENPQTPEGGASAELRTTSYRL